MGEQAKKIGEKLEGFGAVFFDGLGWTELSRDKEIKCSRPSHKKRTHGIDLLFKFPNPYSASMQGIIVECKNRQMRSIGKDDIETWIKELIGTIECATSAPELADIDLDGTSLNTGLLLVHANDEFDEKKFYEHLRGLHFTSRRTPINIFVAGNDKINQWTSVFTKIKDYGDSFYLLFPSINGYSKRLQKEVPINALYSKYVLAERTYYTEENNGAGNYQFPHKESIMFFLDDICVDNFCYAWSMFKHFQMQGNEKYVFSFYPRKTGDVDFIKEHFLSAIKHGDKLFSDSERQKITLDYIDNRNLSPVETGGQS